MVSSESPIIAMREFFLWICKPHCDLIALVETEMTEWPRTLKEIDKLIKVAEKHIDDLSIEIGAARGEFHWPVTILSLN
jgi:hypothetical protein